MKKQLILVTLVALSVISCSKKNNVPPSSKGYFRAKVNGVFFSDSTSASISQGLNPMYGPLETLITGHYNNGTITLKLPSQVTAGEEPLAQGTQDAIRINENSGSYFFAGFNGINGSPVQGSGKINILESTNTGANSFIRGTFECIAPVDSTRGIILPPISITEGEFNLKWQ